jgi:hypothetical protein
MPYRIEDARRREPTILKEFTEAKTPEEKLRIVVEYLTKYFRHLKPLQDIDEQSKSENPSETEIK